MRVTLAHNPSSGDEGHDGPSLAALLEDHGHDVRRGSADDGGWAELLAAPADLVVVAGGDGTVRDVFKELAGAGAAVAVLPLGSANNIARTLGVPGPPVDRLVAGLGAAARRRYVLGRATAGWGQASVVESVGGGLFAAVLERAADDAGGDDKIEHGLRVLGEVLAEAEPRDWELDVDGEDASGAFLAVEVMNVRETGPNVPLAPGADPGDGTFEVVRVRPEDRRLLAEYLEERRCGGRPDPPPLPIVRGGRVRLLPPRGRPLRVDDELWPERGSAVSGPVVVTAAGAVDVLVPAV